jgi:N-succinyldiaminopimelate aminotransferase
MPITAALHPRRQRLANRALERFGTTIFAEMTELAHRLKAINLAQGFPDFDGPEAVREAAVRAVRNGPNQYSRAAGHPRLVEAIAADVERRHRLTIDPMKQVVVGAGATELLHCALIGMLNPGDEVVLFEPFYDAYPVGVAMAGATARYVTLRAPHFRIDPGDLERAINPRTRLILLNSPHNPTGRVFEREELRTIASVARRHDLVVLSDEVYEHITFGAPHIPIATLPDMASRTLTISSAGKTYSLTGWKVGWAWGPEAMVSATLAAHQFTTFCAASPLQDALVAALELPESYYEELRSTYRLRRNFLVAALQESGFEVHEPEGTYFVMAGIEPLGFDNDRVFARWLAEEHGVVCIPPSVFYEQDKAEGMRMVRFAFCKVLPTLRKAAERLLDLPATGYAGA